MVASSIRRSFLSTLGLLLSLTVPGIGVCEPKRTSQFNEQWLEAIVSIEQVPAEGPARSLGTGFFVWVDKKIFLVTARHVVASDGVPLPNLAYRRSDIPEQNAVIMDAQLGDLGGWTISKSNLDLAVRRFGWATGIKEPVAIPITSFISREDLQVGAPLLVLGFPTGLRSTTHRHPLARSGIVARASAGELTVEAFVFPGNSGSPVVYTPPIKVGAPLTSGLVNEEKLVGMIVTSITYEAPASNGQGTYKANSGLCDVVPADEIGRFLNLDKQKN